MSDRSDPIGDLRRCLEEARGNPARQQACLRAFLQAGGRVEDAKVYLAPDGTVVLVVTDSGKLLNCRG